LLRSSSFCITPAAAATLARSIADDAAREARLFARDPLPLLALVQQTRQLSGR
jgi:hypothetical protein